MLDKNIYDARRLFRIPNTINSKTGLYKIPLTIQEIRHLNLTGIQEIAHEPRRLPRRMREPNQCACDATKAILKKKAVPIRSGTVLRDMKNLPPCIPELLSCSLHQGNRNNISVLLASALFQHGQNLGQVLDTITDWNESNTPPLPHKELASACRSAKKLTENGRGYGCSSIRNSGLVSSNICLESCPIHKKQTAPKKGGYLKNG